MDKTGSGKERRDEATRESLISISDALPEKVLSPKPLTETKVNGESAASATHDSDGEDNQFRSELISISDTPSPDVES